MVIMLMEEQVVDQTYAFPALLLASNARIAQVLVFLAYLDWFYLIIHA